MPHLLVCCICKETLSAEADGGSADNLDPCAVILVAHADREWRDQKEQTFYCHFECFRRLIGDDSWLYIMEPDFSPNGEVEDEHDDNDKGQQ